MYRFWYEFSGDTKIPAEKNSQSRVSANDPYSRKQTHPMITTQVMGKVGG